MDKLEKAFSILSPSKVFKAYADSVNRILDREWRKPGDGQANDFCNLAVAGESLRRMCNGHLEEYDMPQPYAFETLAKYDAFLGQYTGEVPDTLAEDVDDCLADIEDYADSQGDARDYEYGTNLLHELENILQIAVASFRARRRIDEAEVIKLANMACYRIHAIEDKLYDVCQYAEDIECNRGGDGQFLNLYGFWEQLAYLSPSRQQMIRVVKEAAAAERRKERIVKSVVANFEKNKKGDDE